MRLLDILRDTAEKLVELNREMNKPTKTMTGYMIHTIKHLRKQIKYETNEINTIKLHNKHIKIDTEDRENSLYQANLIVIRLDKEITLNTKYRDRRKEKIKEAESI